MAETANSAPSSSEASNVTVRRLRPGDEALARDAVNRLKPVEERHGNVVDVEFMREFLASESNLLVVAHDGETPLGYALGYSLPRMDRRRSMYYLHDVGVAESQRGKGIGGRMIRECVRIGREEGFTEMFVIADADNRPAIRLYESTGGVAFPEGALVFGYEFP